MREATPIVGIQTGKGIVARFGDAVVVIPEVAPEQQPFYRALFDVLRTAAAETGQASRLAWRIAELLTSHGPDVLGFGLAARVTEGYLVMLHGSVRALVTDGKGEVELRGADAPTWVERVVAEPVERLAITLADSGAVQLFPHSELEAGVVPGSGVVLLASARGAQTPGPRQAFSPERPPAPVPSVVPAAPVAAAPASPRPVPATPPSPAGPPPAAVPAPPPPPNAGSVPVAPRAGETMVVKMAVGALVADDGTRTLLDRNYVFGREPWKDPDVMSGASSPIVVRDPESLISRAHLHVTIDGAAVMVRDNGSANGTYVAPPGAMDWIPVGQYPAPLPPGWSVRLGMRVFTHVPAPPEGESAPA
jgi:hypothetical protein